METFGSAGPADFNEALIDAIRACGGSKSVGVSLWPSMGVEAAQRKLLVAMNPERAEKLGPDEVLHIMRLARQRGCHAPINFLLADLSYAPTTPVQPADEAAQLQREYIEAARAMAQLAKRIEDLSKPRALGSRAA